MGQLNVPALTTIQPLQQLGWLTLRFKLHMRDRLQIPPVPGILVHSILGMALQLAASDVFADLYGEGDELAKPYAVFAPLNGEGFVPEGGQWWFDVTLFNQHVASAAAVVAAILHLQQLGLGKTRARFDLLGVATLDAEGREIPLQANPSCISFSDLQALPLHEPKAVTLCLLTPLRLKQGGNILTTPPEMHLLVQRLLGRISILLGKPPQLLEPSYFQSLQIAARNCRLASNHTRWMDAERYSASQHRSMTLGGLCGDLIYENVAAELFPWLRLMQHLQLGSKTTIGFGKTTLADR